MPDLISAVGYSGSEGLATRAWNGLALAEGVYTVFRGVFSRACWVCWGKVPKYKLCVAKKHRFPPILWHCPSLAQTSRNGNTHDIRASPTNVMQGRVLS